MVLRDYNWLDFLDRCQRKPDLSAFVSGDFPGVSVAHVDVPIGEGEPYGRVPLFQSQEAEVLLVRWRPDTFCLPHNHALSRGVIYLMQGSFTERAWGWRSGCLQPLSEQTLVAPSLVTLDTADIHDMKALGAGLSVHCYWPPIDQMRVTRNTERRWSSAIGPEPGGRTLQATF
jgi:Cysteine dioxygenase type I